MASSSKTPNPSPGSAGSGKRAGRRLSGSRAVLRQAQIVCRGDEEERLEVLVVLRPDPTEETLPSLEELCENPRQGPVEPPARKRRARMAPSEDLEAVRRFAESRRLELDDTDGDGVVKLSGRAADFSAAFGVDLVMAQHPRGHHRTYRGEVRLPDELAERVLGVFGLDDRPTGRRAAASSLAGVVETLPILPSAVAELYDFPAGTGHGQSVAILELGGGYDRQAMEEYFRTVGQPMPSLRDVSVAGAGNCPGKNQRNDAEVCLDIQVLGSLVPQAELVVYFAPNTGLGFLEGLRRAVFGGHSVVSISWAESEDDLSPMVVRAMHHVLHQAAVLGVTVCVASGDLGAGGEMHPSLPEPYFPGTSPFALACGGSSPIFHGAQYYHEVVWNEGQLATGGGISSFFECPPYQKWSRSCQRSIRPGVGHGRGIPDVGGMSYGFDTLWRSVVGYWVSCNGSWQALGGTSAAAPLWAALVVRLNEHLGWPLGFLQPWLYRMSPADEAFLDIVQGNNANTTSLLGGYPALPGWDACTGLGRPWGRALLAAIERQLG